MNPEYVSNIFSKSNVTKNEANVINRVVNVSREVAFVRINVAIVSNGASKVT